MARICVIRQGDYPRDPRARREVDALLQAGHEVDVICLALPDEPRTERAERLSVTRIGLDHRRAAPLRYLVEYVWFLVVAAVIVTRRHVARRYDLIQVNSLPDSLVFAALAPRLLGARVLLDLHECMPEFFATKYGLAMSHPVVRAIAAVEQASIAFADRALTCTEQMKQRFAERGAAAGKIEVIVNGADERTFAPVAGRSPHGGSFVVIYHGTLEPAFGIDTLVRAVALLKDELPIRLNVFGQGSFRGALERMVDDLDLRDRVWIRGGWAPLDELVAAIAAADVGVVPTKRDPYRDLTLANKMFDLIAMRKPIVVGRTRAVSEYFDESCFEMFESDDASDLARALRVIRRDPELRERRVTRASDACEPYRWIHQRTRYLAAIDALVERDERRALAANVPVSPAMEEGTDP